MPRNLFRRAGARIATVASGLIAGILLIAAADALLGLSGTDLGPAPPDPFAGFSGTQSRFVRETLLDGTVVYRTRPSGRRKHPSLPTEQPRFFPAEKRPGGFRIFIVGGSSAAAVPYGVAYGFGEWLEQRLKVTSPNVGWEVINAAFSGYATRRIVTITDEIAGYQPDLVIVYSGHNEYAEHRYYRHLLDRDPRLFRLMEFIATTNIYRWRFSTDAHHAPAVPTFELDDRDRSFELFRAGRW